MLIYIEQIEKAYKTSQIYSVSTSFTSWLEKHLVNS